MRNFESDGKKVKNENLKIKHVVNTNSPLGYNNNNINNYHKNSSNIDYI